MGEMLSVARSAIYASALAFPQARRLLGFCSFVAGFTHYLRGDKTPLQQNKVAGLYHRLPVSGFRQWAQEGPDLGNWEKKMFPSWAG